MSDYKLVDLDSVKEQADLLALAERDTRLKKVGKEYKGPCPMPGCTCDDDGFSVQPSKKTWVCRHCTGGKYRSVIDYIALRDGLDPHNREQLTEICRRAMGGEVPTKAGRPVRRVRHQLQVSKAPASDWQAAGRAFVDACESALWSPVGVRALAYLREKRGLKDATIRRYRLGYNPETSWVDPATWGTPGGDLRKIWLPRGMVIPCFVRGRLWYVKIRQPAGEPKYIQVRGSRPAIFGADDLLGAGVVLFTEGEIDTLTAWQELGDVLTPVTLGSSTNDIDLVVFGPYLRGARAYLECYDSDQAGRRGAAKLYELIKRLRPCPLPEGVKDINDYHQAGGDLWTWVKPMLDQVDPIQAAGEYPMLEAGRALGGVVRDYGAAMLDYAERANNAGDLLTFARAWARGMILEGEDPQKWAAWAECEYQVPAGEILQFAELVKV